jgi:SOS-response transcriptional repressor LexA
MRLEVAGPRGKSMFAKKLGLSPSTYSYYESTRVPHVDVLIRIAEITGVDLRWLLTGRATTGLTVPTTHPVLQRAAKLLADREDAAAPLAAFLDILSESLKFPGKKTTEQRETPATPIEIETYHRGAWIPVLGRSAAGVPQFWSKEDDSVGLTALNDLISRHARGSPQRARAAQATGERAEVADVQIITLTTPDDEVSEFVVAAGLKATYPDAFAVRIDGDSMSPDIRHGDLVVLSPSAGAADGKPAVVQLKRQIGVTCKIHRLEGERVHLIPINEQFPPQAYPTEQVVWALRVLARIRP